MKSKNGHTSVTRRPDRLPEPGAHVVREQTDVNLLLLVCSHGVVREHVAGSPALIHYAETDICGAWLSDLWPADTAAAMTRGACKAMKTRGSFVLHDVPAESDPATSFEVLILPHGRKRALLVIRRIIGGTGKDRLRGDRTKSPSTWSLADSQAFWDRLGNDLAQARLRDFHLALLRLHVDTGKLDDALGRQAREAVLAETLERIRQGLDDESLTSGLDPFGTELCRTSLDEISVMITELRAVGSVSEIASRVMQSLTLPVELDGQQIRPTVSLGIAVAPQDALDVDALVANADTALQEAKSLGGNCRRFFSGTAKTRTLGSLDSAREIKWALENDQLYLEYQPRINVRSGAVTGIEALLRWCHPLRGLVPLSQVLPLGEQTGLIVPIGQWAIERASETAAAWQKVCNARLAMNLSTREVSTRKLAQRVLRATEAAGLDPHRLELEIKEGDLLRDTAALEPEIRELREHGVRVVVDDFGTGFCSIHSLVSSHASALKIARSVIGNVPDRERDTHLCSAIIAMASELGVEVIATGVETREQSQFLLQHGCDEQQGFLLSQPLSAGALQSFLSTRPHQST